MFVQLLMNGDKEGALMPRRMPSLSVMFPLPTL